MNLIKYGLKELKFIKSFHDLKIFIRKIVSSIPYILGTSERDNKVPPKLQIEPTNRCNVKCICCSTHRSKREKGFMNFDLFKKIIDDAAEIGVKKIHLYAQGESLLHPKIIDMIGYIKSKDIAITLVTNGMLMDEKMSKAILSTEIDSADSIIYSILGFSKKIHESVMQGVAQETVEKNIRHILAMRKNRKIMGPVIEVVFYRMAENEHEEIAFIKKWRNIVDHVVVGNASNQFAGDKEIPVRKKTCRYLWERMTVYWNGDVPICMGDYDGSHILGSLKNQSIREIWNGQERTLVKKFHKGKRFDQLDLCSTCDW